MPRGAVDIVVFALSGTSPSLSIQLQESNDLENWTSKGSAQNVTTVGYTLLTAITAVSTGYVRLKITLSGTSPTAVLSAGLNSAQL